MKGVGHLFGFHRKVFGYSIAAILLVVIIPSSNKIYADSLNPGIYSSESSPFDIPYKEWAAKWWNHNVKFGAEEHPRDHFSPERCNLDQQQSDPVYYLPDNLGGEEDTVM